MPRDVEAKVSLTVNGAEHDVVVDTRTTLLDGLRDRLGIFSPKKGCDHGQCGSCTVLVDGRRIVSCLSFAVSYEGSDIVTAEGLGDGDELHDMQQAFIDEDAFQCGYCTPSEVARDSIAPDSHVTEDLDPSSSGDASPLADDEIRERMSGNLCRCAAYPNILAAIRQAADR